jgi:hypothetical protein
MMSWLLWRYRYTSIYLTVVGLAALAVAGVWWTG